MPGASDRSAYPCVVKFGLYSHKLAFFLILCSKDLEFGRFERATAKTLAPDLDIFFNPWEQG